MKTTASTFTLSAWLALAVISAGTVARAGDVNLLGNLSVNSNLTAQSVTLANVTVSNWNFAPLRGYKYVMVAEGTNDVHRGNNLLAAYAATKTLNPSATNRVAVIVPPGAYNLGSTNLVMDTSYVNLIGLVPAQMTTKQVFIDNSGVTRTKTVANVDYTTYLYNGSSGSTIKQTVDNVRIESVALKSTYLYGAYYPTVSGANTVLRHVAMLPSPQGWSMRRDVDYAGQYVDCVGSNESFSGGTASGTFVDCVGGDTSFGTGAASGTFIGCAAGHESFDAGENSIADGTFIDCVAGDDSFGGESAVAFGTFIGCVAGRNAFGSWGADGTFIDCVGGDESFGSQWGELGGTFINCVGGAYSFSGYLSSTAKLRHCRGGSHSFENFDMTSDDFNYNVGGSNTFLMLPNLPTSTNNLPSGSVYNSGGTLKVMP